MLFFHEEPEPRNYVVTRCASGPRIRGEGFYTKKACANQRSYVYSFTVVNKRRKRVYIYIYISSIHAWNTKNRPSTLLFIQVDRGKNREGETSDVRTSYVDNRNFTLDRTRATRRGLRIRVLGRIIVGVKKEWVSECNVFHEYMYIYDDYDESFLRFSAKILGGDNV